MKRMEELRDMLCDELETITEQGEITSGSLEIIDKLTHSIKSIDTIMAMEESGYSNDRGYPRYDGSYARYGHYDEGYSRRRGYSRMHGRNSAHDGYRDRMMEENDV